MDTMINGKRVVMDSNGKIFVDSKNTYLRVDVNEETGKAEFLRNGRILKEYTDWSVQRVLKEEK